MRTLNEITTSIPAAGAGNMPKKEVLGDTLGRCFSDMRGEHLNSFKFEKSG